MDFPSVSRRKNCLDFKPLKTASKNLPVMLWGEQTLYGFERPDSSPCLDLQPSSESIWHQTMAALHGSLTLPEMARLRLKVNDLQTNNPDFQVSEKEWMESFDWHWRDELVPIFDLMPRLPMEFQRWAADKDLGPRELHPVILIRDFPEYFLLLETLAMQNFPRGEGVQICEMIIELLMMDVPADLLHQTLHLEPQKTLIELRKLRYPQRSLRQSLMEERSKLLPWPKGTQLRWNFLKDQPSLELKVILNSEAELRSLAQSMQQIQDKITSSEEKNPWAH